VLKIGYKASAEQFAPRELLDFAVLAEELGFDGVAVSDHFQAWRQDGGHSPFSFAWLAAVGERTKTIELGTSVVSPIHRYHPGIVAQAMGTLGALYPDRVMLGIGTGEALNEVPLGFDWPDQKERFQRLKEATLLMQKLWTEDRVTFDGNYFQTADATIYDRPENPVPIYIAAAGPAAARLAGRTAQGFITTSGKDPALYSEKLLPAVREGIQKAGRKTDDVELKIELKVSFDEDFQRARQDTKCWGALALTHEEKTTVNNAVEMQELADALPVERTESRWIVSDDPAKQIEGIQQYIDLGFTNLMFHFPGPDQERALRLYAEHVIPQLRGLAGN
jgi:coenzyme F420-dependent glucose-6-phosphate dehydrogenase